MDKKSHRDTFKITNVDPLPIKTFNNQDGILCLIEMQQILVDTFLSEVLVGLPRKDKTRQQQLTSIAKPHDEIAVVACQL